LHERIWGKTVTDHFEELNSPETGIRKACSGNDALKGIFARNELTDALEDLLRRGHGTEL
jgi:hypothetical protein